MLDSSSLCSFRKTSRLALGLYLLAILAGLWLGAPQARAQYEGQRVVKVDVQGSATPSEVLRDRLKTKAGEDYDSSKASDDLSYLAKSMRTALVQIETASGGKGIVVHYLVTDFPRFRKLQTIGNQKLTTKRIEAIAKLKEGDVVVENVQTSLLRALRKEYRLLGMPQAQVTINLIDIPAEEGAKEQAKGPLADLQVVVNEGRQVQVDDVIIRGNKAFLTARLKLQMETKGSWTFIKNYYDEAAFNEDLGKLREFYARHGYFDVKIERGSFGEHVRGGKTVISPAVQISEGSRYCFGTTSIRGAHLFGAAEVQEPFSGLKGELFDDQLFAEAMNKLKSIYQDHGLLTTQIVPEYDYDAKNRIVNLVIKVEEKDRIYVGKIKLVRPSYNEDEKKSWFRGWYERVSPPVKDEAVLREVLLKPGDVYNKRLENDSMRRLGRLGVFDTNPEKLKAYNEPTGDPGVHNMVIEAQEAPTGALSGGVGYGDIWGLFLFGSATERNLHGEADAFSLQFMLGTLYSSASVSYFDRHLGDSENSLLTRLYYTQALRPGYEAKVVGLQSELGTPLSSDWTMYLRGRLEAVNLSRASGYHPREDVNRSYAVATGRVRFEQDTRYPFGNNPREGYLQSFGVEGGYAGGALVRFEAMRDQYWPLTDRLTYRLDAFAGLMPYSSSVLPIEERYFLGGDTDLRGFKFRGAGYFDPEDHDVPTGGAAKLLAKNEIHFPIYEPVSGVTFLDVGLLGENPASWQAPRASTGAGLRFDLQNVQVALDAALPILYQDHDEKRYFHFSLQSSF